MNKVKYFKIDDETIIKFSAEYIENKNGELLQPALVISFNEESPHHVWGMEIPTKSEQAAIYLVENATQEQAEKFSEFILSDDFKKIFERDCDEE